MTTRLGKAECWLAMVVLALGRTLLAEDIATVALDEPLAAAHEPAIVLPTAPVIEIVAQETSTTPPPEITHAPSEGHPAFLHNDAGGEPWTEHWSDHTFEESFPPIWSHWTVHFDALFWRRSTPSGFPLAARVAGEVPDAADFTFNHESGPRLAIIRRGISGWDVELNYLGIESWHSQLIMPIDVDPRLPGDDPDGLFGQDLNLFLVGLTVDYRTTLHSEELNLRRKLNDTWTGLVGFRALQLHERYDTYTNDTGLSFYTITTDNRLYGFQIGGEGLLLETERFRILTVLKAGLFENNSEQMTTDLSGVLAGITSPTDLTASVNQASFAGEIGIWGVYRLSETIFIRAGYNVMWIDDVALAVKQIPVNEFVTFGPSRPLEGIAADGHLVIHGATVGVELSW